jgi:hypothetical protein
MLWIAEEDARPETLLSLKEITSYDLSKAALIVRDVATVDAEGFWKEFLFDGKGYAWNLIIYLM